MPRVIFLDSEDQCIAETIARIANMSPTQPSNTAQSPNRSSLQHVHDLLHEIAQESSEAYYDAPESIKLESHYVTAPSSPAPTTAILGAIHIHSEPVSEYLNASLCPSSIDPNDDIPELVLPALAHKMTFIWEMEGQSTYVPDTSTVCGRTPDEWVESKRTWQLWLSKERRKLAGVLDRQ